MRYWEIYQLYGMANETGFQITTIHPLIDKVFCTKNYKRNDNESMVSILYAFMLTIIIVAIAIPLLILGIGLESLTLIILYESLILALIILSVQLLFPFLMLFLLIIENKFNPSCMRQWHACEHKIINLLESDEDLTIENFKKAPHFHPRDGSKSIISDYSKSINKITIFNYLVIFMLLWIAGHFLLFFLLSALSLTLAIHLCFLSSETKICTFLSALYQLINTAEPEEWQIEESLAVAKEIKQIQNHDHKV